MAGLSQGLGFSLALAIVPLIANVEIDLQRNQLNQNFRTGEGYNLPPAPVVRGLTLGYREVWADILWLRTINYFATHITDDRDISHLPRYLQSIITLDPYFRAIYRYGTAMLVSRGEKQTNDDVFRAIHLLEEAHRVFPNDYRFLVTLGAYYTTELKSPSQPQRDAWRKKGADWIRRAALIGADTPWLPSLAAKIYSEQGQRDLAILHLQELYLTTQHEEMKKQIAQKLVELNAQKLATDLKDEETQLKAHYTQSPLSFVPLDLFVLVDREPLRPFTIKTE